MGFADAVKGAAGDVVEPFKDHDIEAGDDKDKDGKPRSAEAAPEPVWFGPKKIGWFTVALYGPLQLIFMVLAVLAIFLLIWELIREDTAKYFRIIACVGFVLCASYLVWIGKAIYILQMFRREIGRLKACNEEYEKQNEEHKKLNGELSDKIKDLGKVETQLKVLANECSGSVEQARALLTRLEGSVKLNAVSSVFVFFDKADRDKSGKIDENEVGIFVQNLGFLFDHLEGFSRDDVKKVLKAQGGITLEQVHDLVDSLMLEDEKGRKDFGKTFKAKIGGAVDAPPAAPAAVDDEGDEG